MRFFHIADLHLGFPLREDENKFDHFKSFSFIAEKAVEYKIDVVLIAGDVFHYRDPEASMQSIFSRFLRDLVSNNIRVIIITGNHEGPAFRERSIHLDVYDNLKVPLIYVSKKPEIIKMKDSNFLTLPYPFKSNFLTKEENRNRNEEEVLSLMNRRLLEALDEKLSEVEDGSINVLIGHIPLVEGDVGFEKYINISKELPLSVEEIDRSNISYFALGHLHKRQVITSRKYAHPFVYAGSLDRLDFGEEHDEKRFLFC